MRAFVRSLLAVAFLALTLPSSFAQPAAIVVSLAANVRQQGAIAGIRNSVFTRWLPAGYGFAGLQGQVTLTGNAAAFSEALVLVGASQADQATCLASNNTAPAQAPAVARLWGGIVKSNGAIPVSLPVSFVLPHPVGLAAGGSCVLLWVSAGYPYLSTQAPRYANTSINLSLLATPAVPGGGQVVPLGLGGEFRMPATDAAPDSVYVGFEANRTLDVDALAGSVSAAPVANAPPNSGWLPTPAADWSLGTFLYYLPVAACAESGLRLENNIGPLSIIRLPTPSPIGVPDGAVLLQATPLRSQLTQPAQQTGFSGFTLHMAPGDCLFQLTTAQATAPGLLDAENQSTLYLRLPPAPSGGP